MQPNLKLINARFYWFKAAFIAAIQSYNISEYYADAVFHEIKHQFNSALRMSLQRANAMTVAKSYALQYFKRG